MEGKISAAIAEHSRSEEEVLKYIYSNNDILSEVKTESGRTLEKSYINGLGTDNVIGYVFSGEYIDSSLDGEINFCNNRVNNFSGEFLQYNWTGIVERCEYLKNNAFTSGSMMIYYVKDRLGSIVGLQDMSGNTLLEYEYDAFGKTYIKNSSGNIEILDYTGNSYNNDRLFTSREYDRESGLYFYRARYYDAELGRFISQDPIGIKDDINLYNYVGGNPVNWADPLGLEKSLLDKTKDVLQDTLDDMGDSLNKGLDNASYGLDKLEDGAYNTLIVVGGKLVIEGTVSFANGVPICTAAGISVAMTAGSDFAVAGSVCLATMGPGALSLGAGGIMMAVGEAGKEAKDRRRPSKDLSDKIRERDGNKCIYCGKKTNTDKTSNPDKSEIDHKKPWSKGGKTDEDNLQNTCRTCNRKKATNTDPDFRAENGY